MKGTRLSHEGRVVVYYEDGQTVREDALNQVQQDSFRGVRHTVCRFKNGNLTTFIEYTWLPDAEAARKQVCRRLGSGG